jgi:hypothetical protein
VRARKHVLGDDGRELRVRLVSCFMKPLILLPLGCVELLLYVIRNVIVGFLCILSLHMQNQGLQLARLERVVLLLFGSCQQYGPRGQGGPGHRIISYTPFYAGGCPVASCSVSISAARSVSIRRVADPDPCLPALFAEDTSAPRSSARQLNVISTISFLPARKSSPYSPSCSSTGV